MYTVLSGERNANNVSRYILITAAFNIIIDGVIAVLRTRKDSKTYTMYVNT